MSDYTYNSQFRKLLAMCGLANKEMANIRGVSLAQISYWINDKNPMSEQNYHLFIEGLIPYLEDESINAAARSSYLIDVVEELTKQLHDETDQNIS